MTLEKDHQAETSVPSDIASGIYPSAPEHQAGSGHPAFTTKPVAHLSGLPDVIIIGRESPETIHSTTQQNQALSDSVKPARTVEPSFMTPDGLMVDFDTVKTDLPKAPQPMPVLHPGDEPRQPSAGGSTWISREAGEVSSAALTTLSDFESATAKAASDVVHGKATAGEIGILAVEAGSLVGLGAAFAMAAGATAPVLCPIVVGGMAVAVGGELLMMAEMKHWL